MNAPVILSKRLPTGNQTPRNEAIDAFLSQLSMSEQVRVLSHILEGAPCVSTSDDFCDALYATTRAFTADYRAISNAAARDDMKARAA